MRMIFGNQNNVFRMNCIDIIVMISAFFFEPIACLVSFLSWPFFLAGLLVPDFCLFFLAIPIVALVECRFLHWGLHLSMNNGRNRFLGFLIWASGGFLASGGIYSIRYGSHWSGPLTGFIFLLFLARFARNNLSSINQLFPAKSRLDMDGFSARRKRFHFRHDSPG